MTEEEKSIEQEAIAFAKANKKAIAQELTDLKKFPADQIPVSVFMAGSPGAGKTEASQNLIKRFSSSSNPILRIDTDEIRSKFSGYTGKNSHLFQGSTSIIADKMHDLALSNKQSFVFDGTLSNLVRAQENINRSLSKGRFVQIIYVYQDPLQAWQFVKAREIKDGRHVPCESFIHQYWCTKKNIDDLLVAVKLPKSRVFIYQLEAPFDVRVKRAKERWAAGKTKRLLPPAHIKKNDEWYAKDGYRGARVFDSNKLSTKQIAKEILKDIKL